MQANPVDCALGCLLNGNGAGSLIRSVGPLPRAYQSTHNRNPRHSISGLWHKPPPGLSVPLARPVTSAGSSPARFVKTFRGVFLPASLGGKRTRLDSPFTLVEANDECSPLMGTRFGFPIHIRGTNHECPIVLNDGTRTSPIQDFLD